MKKNPQISSIASAIAVLALLVWVGTSLAVWRSPVEGAPQNPKRMLRREHPRVGEPINITKVTVDGNEVEFNKEFDAGDDWYRSIAMTVENRSGKPIVFVELGMLCRRLDGSAERMAVFEFTYGGSLILAAREGKPVAPGDSVELRLSANNARGVAELLAESGYSSLRQIDVSVRDVLFADGTRWALGTLYAPNSNTSMGWSAVAPKQPIYFASARAAQKRKYAHAFSGCIHTYQSFDVCTKPPPHVDESCGTVPTDKFDDGSINFDSILCDTSARCRDAISGQYTSCGVRPTKYSASCYDQGECNPACDEAHRYSCFEGLCTDMSPILIDVDGDGFNLTNAVNGVDFDLTRSGFANRISWTAEGSDDAWLALDRNGNGVIDDGAELFGSVTPQSHSGSPNGFNALAEFDKAENGGDHNGVIDRRDAVFAHLLLWQDDNHNGVSEVNELHNFASLKLKAIALDCQESKKTDEFGNRFKYRAKVYDTHGSHVGRWAWDVFLLSVGQ